MTQEQGIELARDFVVREFVERGMIADLNVHWDIGADGLAKPPAHVMLTMRSEEHTSELQSLMRISYAVFCLKKKYLQRTTTSIFIQNNIKHLTLPLTPSYILKRSTSSF